MSLIAAFGGIAGNILINQRYLGYSLTYFVPIAIVVVIMSLCILLLAQALILVCRCVQQARKASESPAKNLLKKIYYKGSETVKSYKRGTCDMKFLGIGVPLLFSVLLIAFCGLG